MSAGLREGHAGSLPIVSWLLERSFGGRQAVAVPGHHAHSGPLGPFPAGVEALIDHMVASYGEGRRPARDQWAFLIGAPGNGKSEAMRLLAARLGLAADRQGKGIPAPRSLDGVLAASGVAARLVNDASIPRADRPAEGSLARDLLEASGAVRAGTGYFLFANVNRGVLVEEIARARQQPAADLLAWLDAAAAGTLGGDPSQAFYARRLVELGDKEVVVHAISLDAASLFEPQPGPDVALDFSNGDEPVVGRYQPVGGLGLPSGTRRGAVATSLLDKIVERAAWEGAGCSDCAAAALCPLTANARWLREPNLKERFLELGRAAEVAAGRRMTYRDLLGHISLAVLGPMEADWIEGIHPCGWVRDLATHEGPRGSVVALLSRHRIFASLFPPPNPGARSSRRGRGAIRHSDPYAVLVEDFGPGSAARQQSPFAPALHRLDPARSIDDWPDDARVEAIDAAEAMHVEPPTEFLFQKGIIPADAVSALDLEMDGAIAEALEAAGNGRREGQMRRWRSVAILRHVGLARGQMADGPVIGAWLHAQQGALASSDPGDLVEGLQSWLIPSDGPMRLAPYRPRTRALGDHLPASTLLVLKRSNELSLELRAIKDALQVLLRPHAEPGAAVLPIPVDLDIAREALLLALWTGGFTDLPEQAMARVERLRASLVSRGRMRQAKPTLHLTDAEGRLHVLRGSWGSLSLSRISR